MLELPSYRTIVVATDGSPFSKVAELHALALGRYTGARIEAISVVDRHVIFQLEIFANEAILELGQDGRQALEAVAERARQVGVEIGTRLLEGRPGQMIVREAEGLGADLIVMGSHGHGALLDMILGSVSLYVVHHSQIPVCVVRPPRVAVD
jgi:nucleotide-binding universal stress UspA family protein